MLTRVTAALVAAAAAVPASADFTDVFSTTTITAFSAIERLGQTDSGDDIFDFFLLDQLGSMNETRQSIASLPATDALASTTSVGSFATDTDSINLAFDSSASASLDARDKDTFAIVRSRVAHITRFTTDEFVRVTLSGNAAIDFDLNPFNEPPIPQSVLVIVPEFKGSEPVFEAFNFEDDFFFEVILAPGAYQFRFATDATFQALGVANDLLTVNSDVTLHADFTTVPGASGAALLAIPAFFTRKRNTHRRSTE